MPALTAAAIATAQVVVFGVNQKSLLVIVILIWRQPRMWRKTLAGVVLIFFGWKLVHIKIVFP